MDRPQCRRTGHHAGSRRSLRRSGKPRPVRRARPRRRRDGERLHHQEPGHHDTRGGGATAISNGRIAGFFDIRNDAENSLAESPAFVSSGGVLTIIVTRQPVAEARGVNPDGIVVGFDLDPRNDVNPLNPWVARTDGTEYLPKLSDGNAAAQGINRLGTIAGSSTTATGQLRAVIWRRQ